LAYLLENKTDIIFPYKQINKIENVQSGYDDSLKLSYIIHNGKKLYFPLSLSIKNAESTYKNFIENENITGIVGVCGGYREKHPHQYQSDTFFIQEGDVFCDIGCAEALLALDVIDKVKSVYLVESDPMWLDALKATFKPYKDKVTIIDKLISDVDTETTITLSSLLKNEKESPVFIKMDIEGYETSVIEASKEFLLERQNIRIACCTYHRQNDADRLARIFSDLHYEIEYSDGYMLFIYDKLKAPYFRKGVIRAKKG
jgi:hypothetical protein